MRNVWLIVFGICCLILSQDAAAQWVEKLNAKNEVRIVYEVPRLSVRSVNDKNIPPAPDRPVTGNTPTIKGSTLVAVDYVYSEGFTIVEQKQGDLKWGFMRNVLLEDAVGNFEDVRKFREGMAGIKLNGKWGFVDRSRTVAITPVYDDISYFSEGLAGVSINKKYGFVNKTGKLVIPVEYDDVTGLFDNGKIAVSKNNEQFFINRNGEKVQADYKAAPYSYPAYFGYGVTAVKIWDKWAFYSEKSEMLTHFIYSNVTPFQNGLAGVKLNGKWGFIDIYGSEVIAPAYDEIVTDFEKGTAVVVMGKERFGIDRSGKKLNTDIPLDGRYGFMTPDAGVFALFTNYVYDISTDKPVDWGFNDQSGKMVIPLKILFTEGFSKVKYKGKWGFIDAKGSLVIPADMDEISSPFANGTALVIKNGNQYKIDATGKQVGENVEKMPAYRNYDYEGKYLEGMAQVSVGNKYGYIDEKRREVVPPIYDHVGYFGDGLAPVTLDGKTGFVDKTGELMIPLEYEDVLPYRVGLVNVKKGGKWGFVEKHNRVIIALKYEKPTFFFSQRAIVRLGGKFGLIDMMGNEVAPIIYDELQDDFAGGYRGKLNGNSVAVSPSFPKINYTLTKEKFDTLIPVKTDGKYGYNNKKGQIVVPAMFVYAAEFHEGYGTVLLNDKQGLIDLSGQLAIPVMYDDAVWFSEGRCAVRMNGKWGFIDIKNNLVIPYIYDQVRQFYNGAAAVRSGDKWGFIDKTGKVIIRVKYTSVEYFVDGVCAVRASSGRGYINLKGVEIIPPVYDEVKVFKDGKVEVIKNGISSWFDKTGKKVSR